MILRNQTRRMWHSGRMLVLVGRMDFEEFEQLVLKVLFETDVPITAAHVAYLGRISVRTAERHLARMVEQGTMLVRTGSAGVVEYVYPGRKPLTNSGAGNALTVG